MSEPAVPIPLRCIDAVELLTAYLDGAMGEESAAEFEDHLAGCAGCQAALAQWRTVISLSARLTAEDIERLHPDVRHGFDTALRAIRRR